MKDILFSIIITTHPGVTIVLLMAFFESFLNVGKTQHYIRFKTIFKITLITRYNCKQKRLLKS